MEYASHAQMLFSEAWIAIVFSFIWHFTAFVTRARFATWFLEKH